MALIIKLAQGASVHRLRVESPDTFTFADLQAHFRKVFPSLVAADLYITYVDADGDHIVVSNDEELADALATIPDGTILKLSVEPTPTKASAPASADSSSASKTDDPIDVLLQGPLGNLAASFGIDTEVLRSLAAEASQNGHDLHGLAGLFGPGAGAFADPQLLASILPQFAELFGGNAAPSSSAAPAPAPTAGGEAAGGSAAGVAGTTAQDASRVHSHVVCDGCGVAPIVGARFKSLSQADFDLCEACEASGAFDDQLFMRINSTQQAPVFSTACGRRATSGCPGRGGLGSILSQLFAGRSGAPGGCGRWAAHGPRAAATATTTTPSAPSAFAWGNASSEDEALSRAIEESLRDLSTSAAPSQA